MGFGSDLKNSHEAVLKLQDWELRLLETVKKFMALRIKSDKEYASTLQNLCNQVDKESTVQMNYVSNVSKVSPVRELHWSSRSDPINWPFLFF
uniref:F-BAR domain-containing protein n=1 Tax=Felis catus TaxID=9685 RepID=A0ABI7ZA87_FELCA